MRVAVIGATGLIGTFVVRTLVASGHDVVALARSAEKARTLSVLGASAHRSGLLDHDGLVALMEGADVVCNVATRAPVGVAALRPRAWRVNDLLRTEGVRRVVEAAREARVRRVVQESVSFVYADQGDEPIDEDAPLTITRATEPVAVGESHVQDFVCGSRSGVVLRFGTIVGNDATSRRALRSGGAGHLVTLGSPQGWAHVVHTDDLGPAVLAALHVPSGVYNVGAQPVRREDLAAGLSGVVGREPGEVVGSVVRRLGGARLEPWGRSLRVSSDRFAAVGGWVPRRPVFDPSWLQPDDCSEVAR